MRLKIFRKKTYYRHLLLFAIAFSFTQLEAQGLRAPDAPPGVVSVTVPVYKGLQRFFVDSTLFQSNFSKFRRILAFDSSQQYVDIRETLFGHDFLLPIRMPLEDYVRAQLNFRNQENLRNSVLKYLQRVVQRGGGGIELNIPVRIKSKAFKRIFGGDQVGLTVSGNISFELSGRTESRSGSAVSAYEQRNTFSPKFRQTQQFNVQGRVGDKVRVSVDQNSEATFDFENTLRLTYDGDEDEIIQKIEAGNVSLNLPSTNYVSMSARHQGLFGLKTQMKLGNLSFIGIASLQRGEKQKLSITGAAEENTYRIKDIDYVRDRFFFVDSIYYELFENFDDRMRWVQVSEDLKIVQLDVWRSARPTDYDRQGYAVVNPEDYPDIQNLELQDIPGKIETGFFKRLEYGRDYDYDENRGFFWLNEQVNEQDVIAIAYQTAGGFKRGMLFQELPQDSTAKVLLKLIKPRASKPEYKSTWKLAMRNVYNLGASGIPREGFDVKIIYSVTGEDQEIDPTYKLPFNYLMGLDRINEQGDPVEGGDKKVDIANGWVFDLGNGYLIFPSTTPFAPKPGSKFAFDSTLYVDIYNIKDRTLERTRHKFEIAITTSSVSTSYNLGFNVLENSVVVRVNGRELKEKTGYIIDYFSGKLEIIDPEARRADAQIEIEYERGSLFQLDKKTLLGGRLEYDLGEGKFIGLTALYYNQSTLDQRIRIGQEPIRNFIWDINTAFNFKPNFITKALDKLPIVETSAESKLKLEAEYAQVNPNPNTFNEPRLGEKSGVAYIDDFEGSKRSTPLGVNYRNWSFASIPARFRIVSRGIDHGEINTYDYEEMLRWDKARVKMNWYNPFEPVPIKEIWPNKDVNAQTGTTTQVLNIRWVNYDTPVDSAWAGIMRSTIAFPDQKKTKYIELWVRGDVGQINIDIGRISEDYWIRGTNHLGQPSFGNLNTEDVNLNDLLDEGEDVGIDGIPDGQPGDDPEDNFVAPQDAVKMGLPDPFWRINGTEGNGDPEKGVQGVRAPDTEDLDGRGNLDIFNDYFEYNIDLSDPYHPYIQGATEKGWKQYRIPIRNYDFKVGSPDTTFQEIFYVRLWINNLEPDGQPHVIQIATFDFVGNEWEEKGMATSDTSKFVLSDSLFILSVYNTEENAESPKPEVEPYHSPPNVTGIRDRITRALSKEQSLVMQLKYLPVGGVAEAKKQLIDKINLLYYRRMKMFVHGDWSLPEENSPLEFYIRFGPTEDIYYEYGERVYPHWDKRNNIDIIFDELTRTKQPQYLLPDSLNGKPVYYREDPNFPGKYMKVVGKPSLHNINFFVIGARNVGDTDLRDIEIWLDELRVTDVERESGVAMRMRADLNLADVGRISAQMELVDDNFRKLEQKYASERGTDMTRENQLYNFNLNLHKFLPSSWGFNIPIFAKYQRNQRIPKYYYNSDRRTFYRPNNILDRLKTFVGLTELSPELKENSTITQSRSIGVSFSRRGRKRDPWYLRYTLNQVKLDMDYVEKNSSSPTVLLNNGTNLTGKFSYSINFSNKNFIQPFSWLGKSRWVRALSRQKFYYTPSNISVNASIVDRAEIKQNRLEVKRTETIRTNTSRQFNMNYKVFESLKFDFRRAYQSDAYLKGYRAKDVLKAIFNNFDFGVDKTISQRFNVNYQPRFFSWLNTTFRYSSDFNYNLINPKTNDRMSRLNVNKQMSFNLSPFNLAIKLYKPKAKGTSTRKGRGKASTRGAPRRHARDEEQKGGKGKKTDQAKEDVEGEKKKVRREPPKLPIPNPAILLWKMMNSWKSLRLDIQQTENYQHYNLERMPVWRYQLGLQSDPQAGVDTTFRKIPRLPTLRISRKVTFGSQFNFGNKFKANFNYTYNRDQSQTNQQNTVRISSGYFFTGDDPEKNKDGWWSLVPDWTFQLSGLEKFLFFSKFAKTITVEHSRNGKFNEAARLNNGEYFRDQWSYSNSYQPFLGVTINTKWGMNVNIRYASTRNFSYNATGAVTLNEQGSFDASATYSVRKGFRLPLPFLSKKRLKNEVQFTLTFTNNSSRTLTKRPGSDKFLELSVNKNWKIRPSASYRFSAKVNGSAFFEKGVAYNKRTGKYSYLEFGINVNIAIR